MKFCLLGRIRNYLRGSKILPNTELNFKKWPKTLSVYEIKTERERESSRWKIKRRTSDKLILCGFFFYFFSPRHFFTTRNR